MASSFFPLRPPEENDQQEHGQRQSGNAEQIGSVLRSVKKKHDAG
jgi:hypothetical protein